MIDEATIFEALRRVIDPEIGLDVVALGLVYRVAIDGAGIDVDMTMTTPACPVGPLLCEQAAAAIRARLPEATDVRVRLVWEPPWHQGLLSAEAKRQLGWDE